MSHRVGALSNQRARKAFSPSWRWVCTAPQLFAQRALEGVNRSSAWGLRHLSVQHQKLLSSTHPSVQHKKLRSVELRSFRIGSSWKISLYYVSFISEFNLKSREFGANWWIRVRICGWSFLCRVNRTATTRTLNQLRFFATFSEPKQIL